MYQGNTLTVTDAQGKWKTHQQDAFGNLEMVTEPRPGSGTYTTNYTYNRFNQLLTVSMLRDNVTQHRTFTYYDNGKLKTRQEPETGTVTLSYNSYGLLATKVDQKQQAVAYTYDPTYRRLKKIEKYPLGMGFAADACQAVDFYWDNAPNNSNFSAGATRRLAAVEYRGTRCGQTNGNKYLEEYAYTTYGAVSGKRLTVTKQLAGGPASSSLTAYWTYDGEGRPSTVQYPLSGDTYQYTYDPRGLPQKLVKTGVGGGDIVSSTAYGAGGELTSLAYGNGTSEARTYNSNGQLTTLALPGRTITYTFPALNNGKVSSITDGSETVNYAYDELSRLTSATGSTGWSQAFAYDGFGNLTGKSATGTGIPSWTGVSVDPANNRLSGVGYDLNGNQTTLPMNSGMTDAFTATYDVDNRMIQAVNSSQSRRSEYDYDASNKRIWERRTGGTAAGEWVYFFGAGGEKMGRYSVTVGASSISLSVLQASVYFAGKLVKSGANWVLQDRLASVGKYLPYGEEKIGGTPGNPGDDSEKFATYTRDAGTGVDYADQRWYSQGVGRFLTADPYQRSALVSDSLSWNRYTYAKGDPANGLDPSGELTIIVTGTGESNPDWARPGSAMWNRVRDIFGETDSCVVRYDWPTSLASTIFGQSIADAAAGLSKTVLDAMSRCPGQPLNMVGYSHGGNVIAMYSGLPNAQRIANVITMGTPVRPDFQMNSSQIGALCTISSTSDMVQFFGATPEQIAIAITAYERWVSTELDAAAALKAGDENLFWQLQAEAAGWYLTAQQTVMSTRIRLSAQINVTIGSLAAWPVSRDEHSAIRSPGVWDAATSNAKWGCRATP